MTKPLTPKQARFAEEYLVDFNATQAAIRSGYSPKGARVQGVRLLTNANVASAIRERQQETDRRLILTRERALQLLGSTAERCIADDHPQMVNAGLNALGQIRAMQGWDAPSRSESGKPGEFAEISEEQLDDEIARLELAVDNTGTEG